ncbi:MULTISPECIES: DUF3024 domain-containing protein [unclassified Bradyrhizobium]|uniref:DUF3024 domain-containing protein n=1 Tax=unclassified Bradyrhizobium TaxID=2631580 RepID=UPI00247A927C|nr:MULTISPECIES: DUF3024 domain-containing protein [unclassified Bradyrhizobium]WGR93590.1 DUF3024 domain-containing protein [Bradyrhizobium sp. ISRA435]WGR98149.1 DUF3024 domain-containing protein [Bradyrhizobium sp. ISRA436]WGS05038.1 DUF3024 domain-containing protein [Bradyrhizobium sp. ISRA437]WGS11923.1 DUF3024 domain-containing protein [Bradyrhizobium sp. ISRA443]WGS19384.1 DUF3024 domain-containing protein [Bradyrhizobium sp. ISRA463]
MTAAVVRKSQTGLVPHPNELDRKRIERALITRNRYRYVMPNVKPVRSGYLVESPCCSHNIDKGGGLIDIALVHYDVVSEVWKLFFKNHVRESWEFYSIFQRLTSAIDELNADPERLFWQ